EAAVGQARAAEVEAQAARIELSGNVARAYVQLGYAYAQQDVAKAELQRANESRELTRQRVAAGIDNQLQLKQGDAEVASAEEQQAVADRDRRGAVRTVGAAGQGPGSRPRHQPTAAVDAVDPERAGESAGGSARPSRRSG